MRTLAWLAGEEELLDAFRQGVDPYKLFATKLYSVSLRDVTKEQRRVAKAAVLALGYGQGAGGFLGYCEGFGVPMDPGTAQHVVDVYRASHPNIVNYWSSTYRQLVRSGGQLELPTGRKLVYPDMEQNGQGLSYQRPLIFSKGPKGHRDTVKLWHGLVTENVVQAVARDVVVLGQTLELARHWPVVISVHDEVVLCVPDAEAEEAKAHAEQVFSRAPEWAKGLPVGGEAVISKHYGVKP